MCICAAGLSSTVAGLRKSECDTVHVEGCLLFLHGAPLVRSMLSTTFIVVVGLGVPLYVAASRFAEVGERKCYTSFVEECKRQVSVRVKGGTVKHSFVGSM